MTFTPFFYTIFLHQIFVFLHLKFCFFYTNFLLHQAIIFEIFAFTFFYTNFFVPNSLLFEPNFVLQKNWPKKFGVKRYRKMFKNWIWKFERTKFINFLEWWSSIVLTKNMSFWRFFMIILGQALICRRISPWWRNHATLGVHYVRF